MMSADQGGGGVSDYRIMGYDDNECLHGLHRDWCAICKGIDEMPSPQRNDNEDRFVNNLVKELSNASQRRNPQGK